MRGAGLVDEGVVPAAGQRGHELLVDRVGGVGEEVVAGHQRLAVGHRQRAAGRGRGSCAIVDSISVGRLHQPADGEVGHGQGGPTDRHRRSRAVGVLALHLVLRSGWRRRACRPAPAARTGSPGRARRCRGSGRTGSPRRRRRSRRTCCRRYGRSRRCSLMARATRFMAYGQLRVSGDLVPGAPRPARVRDVDDRAVGAGRQAAQRVQVGRRSAVWPSASPSLLVSVTITVRRPCAVGTRWPASKSSRPAHAAPPPRPRGRAGTAGRGRTPASSCPCTRT